MLILILIKSINSLFDRTKLNGVIPRIRAQPGYDYPDFGGI